MTLRLQSNYRTVQLRLKTVDPAVRKGLRTASLRAVGVIVEDAKARASWSETIPGAIVPTATQTYVGVKARGSKVPIAALNERRAGKWRHPVYGNRSVWREQRAKPSVRPAVKAHAATVVAGVKVATDLAIREAGFK